MNVWSQALADKFTFRLFDDQVYLKLNGHSAKTFCRGYAKNPTKDFLSYTLETLALINYVLRDRPVDGLTDYLVQHKGDLSLRASAYLLLADIESGAII